MGLLLAGLLVILIVLSQLILWAARFKNLHQRTPANPGTLVPDRPKVIVDDPDCGWVLTPNGETEVDGVR